MIADEVGAAALVCLGYPFHPPGQSWPRACQAPRKSSYSRVNNTRLAGPFGRPDGVADYHLLEKVRIVLIEASDHSLKPPACSGRTEVQNLASAISEVQRFLADLRLPTGRR
jgi:predicted alpha/beta-hydrolase family hydrolase